MFPQRYFPGGTTKATAYVWPDPDPEGPIIRPLAKLATLLAATAHFRTRCGLESDDPLGTEKLLDGRYGCKRRIFYPDVDWHRHNVFPSAVLQFGPDWKATTASGGDRNYLVTSGNLRLILIDEDNYPRDVEKSLRDFGIWIGQLLDDLKHYFAYSDELAGTTITQEDSIKQSPVVEEVSRGKAYWTVAFLIDWKS